MAADGVGSKDTNILDPEEFEFTEYDGMTLLETAEAAAGHIHDLKSKGKWRSRWQYEGFANHSHADVCAVDRERVRQELQLAVQFSEALRREYPARSFVISHIPGYAVSFYQAVEGAPIEGVLPVQQFASSPGLAWCQTCQRAQPYRPLPLPDAEFPQAEWGRCEVCGVDVLTWYGEILTPLPGATAAEHSKL